jgi:hypothetical protein
MQIFHFNGMLWYNFSDGVWLSKTLAKYIHEYEIMLVMVDTVMVRARLSVG